MADLVQTDTNVVSGTGASTATGTAGGTITAGMPVYLDSATNTIKAVDSDASAAAATVVGIALNGGATGQPIKYQTAGLVNLGATLTVGAIYVASDTAGGIMPAADLETGDYVTVLGVATTAALMKLGIIVSGVQVP